MSEDIQQLNLRKSKLVVYLKSKLDDGSYGRESFVVLSSKHPHEVIQMWRKQGGIYRMGHLRSYGMQAHFVPWSSVKQIEFDPDVDANGGSKYYGEEQLEYFEGQEVVYS